eukprot:TRINITY_DN2981_c0_g1_i1.p1 TRINITY_DN2981_c0_g1~~TRINITY_DN2981_c0_g1_i1.p1  ORF type:complete len:753 (-),score=269.12 TRINITY_DN2981_c0_g1_i1:256-2514(-)
MAPWAFLAGAAVCVLLPQHRATVMVAGAVVGLFRPRKNGFRRRKVPSVHVGESIKKVDLQWTDMRCVLLSEDGKDEKALLDNINGEAKAGKLLAIMGPSGAGKTTLLLAIAGRLQKSKKIQLTGRVLLNGAPRSISSPRQVFVPQDDMFFSQLTVRETLVLAAKMQLPEKMADKEKEEVVENLMQKLGLVSVAETVVGDAKVRGISGGEKKRLSVACELVGRPSVIFADEPTTGLDAYQAQNVMETLRSLAQEGHTVICTIHQPRGSIYNMFDDLMLIGNGRLVYSGPAGEAAAEYFSTLGYTCPLHTNPAEFFSDLIGTDFSSPQTEQESKERVGQLAKAYAEWRAAKAQVEAEGGGGDEKAEGGEEEEEKGELSSGLWTQFRMLLKRAWKQTTRDKSTNVVRGMMSLTSALIFGSVFWRMGLGQTSIQDRMGLLQVVAINTAMSSLTKTLNVFPKERLIVERERTKGSYAVAPYFASKLIAELPISALFPLGFGILVYPMTGLNKSLRRFGQFLGLLTMESFTAAAMGLTVGCIAPSTEAAMALGPSIMTVFIVFGGYYVNAKNTPTIFQWIPSVSFIRWTFEALSINEFRGLKFETSRSSDTGTGEEVLDRLFASSSPSVTLSPSLKLCVRKQVQIMLFWYWASAYLLRTKEPQHQPLLPPPPAPGPAAGGSAAAATASKALKPSAIINGLEDHIPLPAEDAPPAPPAPAADAATAAAPADAPPVDAGEGKETTVDAAGEEAAAAPSSS